MERRRIAWRASQCNRAVLLNGAIETATNRKASTMAYQMQPVELTGSYDNKTFDFNSAPSAPGFPLAFNYALFSFWLEMTPHASGGVQLINNAQNLNLGFRIYAGSTSFTLEPFTSVGNGAGALGEIQWNYSQLTGWHHFLISVDSSTARAQLALDGVLQTAASSSLIAGEMGTIAASYFQSNFVHSALDVGTLCLGDFYAAAPSFFYDLALPARIAAFISSSGSPVYLGSDGTAPPALTHPVIYLTVPPGGSASDFPTNYGNGPPLNAVPAALPTALCMDAPPADPNSGPSSGSGTLPGVPSFGATYVPRTAIALPCVPCTPFFLDAYPSAAKLT